MTKRRYQAISNNPGILRILTLDDCTGRWEEPERGKKFQSYRYVIDGKGKNKKISKCFSVFSEAVDFHKGKGRSNEETEASPIKENETEKFKSSLKVNEGKTFKELAEIWEKVFLPTINISTQIRYKSYLKHLIFFNEKLVEEIQTTDIDAWIVELKKPDYLKKQHSTRCHYKHEFSILKGILVFYVSRFNRNYRLPFIPEHRKLLKVKEKLIIDKDLTVDQFKTFIASLKGSVFGTKWEKIYYLALMQYAIYSRVQEAAALHFEDFDFGRNKITVNKKVQWLRAKGYENKIVDGSKVNGGKELPMSDLAKKVFQEMVVRFGIRSGPLFYVGGEVITYRQIEHKYSKALKASGLPFSATHILRHASLTEFYDSCKDLIVTAKVAGHGNIKSTAKYAKARDERVNQTQKHMDQKLSSLI